MNNLIKHIVLPLSIMLICQIGNAQSTSKSTRAHPGEGVYELLLRNNLSPKEYYEDFCKLNKERLGPENILYAEKEYLLPTKKASSGTFPIFGKQYENVEFLDDLLENAVYYIVGGHGGPDPGAIGKWQNKIICEDEYAYDVSLRLARKLLEHGATVYLITRDNNDGIRDAQYLRCDKDESCWKDQTIPAKPLPRLKQRSSAVNSLFEAHKGKHQRLIIFHVDSRITSQNIDIFFYYHSRSRKGKQLSKTLYQTIKEKYEIHQPGRGYQGTVEPRNGLYMLRKTWPVATYIELGNINHYRDQIRIVKKDNRQAIANWICEGLIREYKEK